MKARRFPRSEKPPCGSQMAAIGSAASLISSPRSVWIVARPGRLCAARFTSKPAKPRRTCFLPRPPKCNSIDSPVLRVGSSPNVPPAFRSTSPKSSLIISSRSASHHRPWCCPCPVRPRRFHLTESRVFTILRTMEPPSHRCVATRFAAMISLKQNGGSRAKARLLLKCANSRFQVETCRPVCSSVRVRRCRR